jgi:hypothetical protein
MIYKESYKKVEIILRVDIHIILNEEGEIKEVKGEGGAMRRETDSQRQIKERRREASGGFFVLIDWT